MISIVIPTYEQQGQGSRYLTELLESIAIQSPRCYYEVVVSDNATDGSIKHVCDKYPFVKYHFNPVRGSSENINNAINLAAFDKVKIMCMDDKFLTKGAIDEYNSSLDKYGWVVTNSKHINDKSQTTGMRLAQYRHGNFTENTVGMPSVVAFKKSEIRFRPELKTVCDMFFYYELYLKFGAPGLMRTYLIGQRFHNASLSRNQPSYHQRDVNYLIRNGMIPGNIPKVTVVVVLHDRINNALHWIKCWNKCDTNGAELVFIHNDNGQDYSKQLSGFRYIKRKNIGFDIGAFQDVCKGRIQLSYDYLLWCIDDTFPMSKHFIQQYLDGFGKRIGVVCMHLSTEITPHIRTTGFCLHRDTASRLLFPADPVVTKDHCWQFEYRARLTLLTQITIKGLRVAQVDLFYRSAMWDSNYHKRNEGAMLLSHILDRTDEHRRIFGYTDPEDECHDVQQQQQQPTGSMIIYLVVMKENIRGNIVSSNFHRQQEAEQFITRQNGWSLIANVPVKIGLP